MKQRLYIFLIIITGTISITKGINNNIATNNLQHNSRNINAADSVIFDLSRAVLTANYVDVPVLFRSNDIINAVDFAFKFNELNLTYDSVINYTPYLSELASQNQLDRFLRFTSSSLQQIANDSILIAIRFSFTVPCGKINVSDFNTITAYLNGDPCSYKFTNPVPHGFIATFNTSNICSGTNVIFNGIPTLTSGTITAWNWNLGNGSTPSVQNPSTTYTNPGNYTIRLITTSGTGCKDTVVKTTTVSSSPVALYTASTDCSNSSATFTDNSTIPYGAINSWSWNYGDSNTDTIPNPTHIYASGGTYTTGLTVVSDSGCTSTISNQVTINSPTAGFGVPNGCVGTSIAFNDSSITTTGTINSWHWYFGDGGSSLSQNTSHIYTSGGVYTVSLKITTNTGCADSIAKTISIENFPVVNFAGDILFGCMPLSVNFSDSSSTSIGSTYLWKFGDNTNASTQNTNHIYLTGGVFNVTHYVTTAAGCADSLTKPGYIAVSGTPVANFGSVNKCVGSTIYFNDSSIISSGAISSWQWRFGDGNSSIQQNTNHIYTSGGSYTVSLKVTTAQGCVDSIAKTITVEDKPIVHFSGNNLVGCAPLTVNFNDSSITSAGSTYFWKFGDNTTSAFQNATHTYTTSGAYSVTHFVTTSGGCADSLIKTSYITVTNSAVANFGVTNRCLGSSAIFTDSSTISSGTITNWNWSFGDGNGSTLQNPTYNYTNAGVYIVRLTVSSSLGCSNTFTNSIVIEDKPVVNFTADIVSGCTPLTVNFLDLSNTAPGSTYFWYFGDNGISSSKDVSHIYTNVGSYTVKHIVTTSAGCSDSLIKTSYITVSSPPVAFFTLSPDTTRLPKATVDLNNLSRGATSWFWNFGDSIYSSQQNPNHNYLEAGRYTVCLKASNNSGCTATYCDTATVLLPNPVAVPKAFTPNGDNINDLLKVRGGPLLNMEWRIFNEWGNQIYFSDTQSEGWDGTFHGSPQPSGVYEYTLKGKTADNAVINIHDIVNLVR